MRVAQRGRLTRADSSPNLPAALLVQAVLLCVRAYAIGEHLCSGGRVVAGEGSARGARRDGGEGLVVWHEVEPPVRHLGGQPAPHRSRLPFGAEAGGHRRRARRVARGDNHLDRAEEGAQRVVPPPLRVVLRVDHTLPRVVPDQQKDGGARSAQRAEGARLVDKERVRRHAADRAALHLLAREQLHHLQPVRQARANNRLVRILLCEEQHPPADAEASGGGAEQVDVRARRRVEGRVEHGDRLVQRQGPLTATDSRRHELHPRLDGDVDRRERPFEALQLRQRAGGRTGAGHG
mmetsp:Transcript_50867/g.163528  ORF Transcript_50867/g.163528 Transcript_50867/m.163528 type:complete len:293 (-) Transcript_50867:83-961(-)